MSGVPWGIAWFPPVVLFLLLRLLGRLIGTTNSPVDGQPSSGASWAWWLSDRFIAGTLLAAISLMLPFDLMLRALVVALMVGGLFAARRGEGPPNPELTSRP
jgi:hypothetical protein